MRTGGNPCNPLLDAAIIVLTPSTFPTNPTSSTCTVATCLQAMGPGTLHFIPLNKKKEFESEDLKVSNISSQKQHVKVMTGTFRVDQVHQ